MAGVKLIAADSEDLEVLATLVQDALVRPREIAFAPRRRQLTLLLSRYRWEAKGDTRCFASLRFGGIMDVKRRGWPAAADSFLELLTVTLDGTRLTLHFAGGAAIRAEIETVDALLEDISEPWRARMRPRHAA